VGPIDFVLIVLIFREFFLFLAISNYFERRAKTCMQAKSSTVRTLQKTMRARR